MYGVAIKIWSSEFDKESDEFKTVDSVVYLCHDIANKDIIYLSTVINHLVGDDCLDDVFKKHVPIVKGEPISWDEPLVKVEQQDYVSGDEDFKGGFDYYADFKEPKPKISKSKPKKRFSENSSDSDNDNDDDEDFKVKTKKPKKPRTGPPLHTLSKPGKCNKCEKECANQGALIAHLKVCNPEQIPDVERKSKKKVYADGEVAKNAKGGSYSQDYNCSYCARSFAFQKSLEKHEYMHLTDPDNPKLTGHLKKRDGKPKKSGPKMPRGNYQCDKCVMVFTLHEALVRHQEAHKLSESSPSLGNETDQGFKLQEVKDGAIMRCTTCDVAYTTHGMYQTHMKKYHHKANVCDDCGKRFTMPNALKNHRLNYHTQFPKTCDDCGHYCATKESFKTHLAIAHGTGTEEAKVPCEICGAMLKNKYSLKAHVKLKHSDSSAGDYPCDTCGKRFKQKASLNYHTRLHTGEFPFRCDECGNGYMRFDNMLDCKNAHAGIFKFHCSHCDYKTNKEKQYKRHLTVHSSEKNFICPLCQHRSSNRTNLSSHIRKCHKITLLQAEVLAKRTRFGHDMTENDLEEAKKKMELSEKVEDTKRNKPEQAPGQANVPNRINMPSKRDAPIIKTQPTDEGSQDSVPGVNPYQHPASRLLFPYF